MANDLNQCNFIGRLGRDPETRSFPSGDRVCNVTIAVGSTWKDKATGEKMERTEWVPVVFNGKLAEISEQYLRKGQLIFVSGEFRTRKWQDKDGNDRYSTEIRADQMQMLGGKSEGGSAPAPAPAAQRRAPAPAPRQGGSGFDDLDEIPF